MKKLVLTVALTTLATLMAQGQLLYRISGNGLEKPSYIVGTYHLAPASFADSIPGLNQALKEVEQVYGEVDMHDALKPENTERMQKVQMLPGDVTLSSLLEKEQLDRLNSLLREVMGADLNDKAMGVQLDRLTPAALSTTLTLLAFMKNNTGINPANLIDTYIQTMAIKQGKKVGGFETVDFQMEVLYGTPLDKQVKDLMCVVDNFKDVVDMADFVSIAYFSQDLSQLEEITQEEEDGPCSSSPEENARLITDRNRQWVKAMPEIMKKYPTFFAVGAAHLCGEEGVLRLLENEGYQIDGVK